MSSHHIKSDKFRSQSLSPSTSPNGGVQQNYTRFYKFIRMDLVLTFFHRLHFSHDEKMEMSHQFYDQYRRKSRVSSRSKEIRDRDRFYQSRSADQFEEPQNNYHQNHQIENLVKHETVSNYGDDDEGKIDEEPPEDLRRKMNVDE